MKKYIFLLITLLSSVAIFAQAEKPEAHINTLGRYKNGKVELRFLPDKKQVLADGIKDGFVIQRALFEEDVFTLEDLDFKTIGKSKAFTPAKWSKAIRKATGKTKDLLQLAKDFSENLDKSSGGTFSLDDGIKELKNAKAKEDFEFMIFGMSALRNTEVAQAVGISFDDPNVRPNQRYVYRVLLAKNTTKFDIHSEPTLVQTKEVVYQERDIYVKLGDTKLSFQWEETDGVSGVLVERKDPNSNQWKLLSETPAYNLLNGTNNAFLDTSLVNYQKYEYRFFGFTPFGEKVQFGHADGIPRDLTPPQSPTFVKAKHEKPKEVHLEWKLDKPMESDFQGFIVARGQTNKGQFEIISNGILPSSQHEFVDTSFVPHKPNYYVVQAIDTSGNISSATPYFVTLIDSIPPAQPKFVSGIIDSNGVVTITLELNKEEDLMGYRLFRANGAEHEFSVIKEGFNPEDLIIKPVQVVFYDTVTLKSLTPNIFYRAKALDYNFNQSAFSNVLKVKRVDTIPPVMPVFKKVVVGTDQVVLNFAPSSSVDVVAHFLYRRTSSSEPWEIIANIPKGQKKYVDKAVKQKVKYYYSLRAKDDSDLYSEYAFPVVARPYDNGVRPVVTDLKVEKLEKETLLTWSYPEKYKEVVFIIYKKDKKGRLRRLVSTDKKQLRIQKKMKKADFAVKAFTRDGGESRVSDVVSYLDN